MSMFKLGLLVCILVSFTSCDEKKSQAQGEGVSGDKPAETAESQAVGPKLTDTEHLVQTAGEDGVTKTASGPLYKVLKAGEGAKPSATDTVEVHYEGKLINGQVFDSSYARGQTISFALNRVIPGWTEGLQLMPVGSTYELTIPSQLGYGARGAGTIPPNATLIFKVELIAIK